MDSNSASEQLEEGEIVDDDDFEDISDNSIIDSAFGKFVSTNEHLRALSLSSDSEIEKIKTIKHKRKLLHRKSKVKQKKRKRIRPPSDSSDSDIIPPSPDLKGKLKEAVRISDIEGGHKNTLEARLKAMGGLAASSELVIEPQPEPIPEPQNDDNSDKIDDAELENLRMEALKTAVLNKCQRRKRKKLLEGSETTEPSKMQENKENNTNNTPKDVCDKNNGEKVDNDIEEDEDVLRATLLAGLAKKIAKKTDVVMKQVAPKLPTPVVPVLPKRPIAKFKANTLNKQLINKVINKQLVNKVKINRPKPQVKPLIINVNGDSDSEEDPKIEKIEIRTPAKRITDLKTITSNVEKFLKEQRAKFETENKKIVTPTNKVKTILEKSAVKLLPKSQQIEYQQLLKKLRNAEREKKAKRLAETKKTTVAEVVSHVTSVENITDVVVVPVESATIEVVVQSTIPDQKKASDEGIISDGSCASSLVKSKSSDDISEGKRTITNELTMLQKTLKDIKMQRNGSLQIKSKYQVLTPIIRKITTTSNDRKKQEHRIKTLLRELNEAKDNLAKSHERFSSLVKELVSKKEQIEESSKEARKVANGKLVKEGIVKDKGESNKKDSKILPVTSTPIRLRNDCIDESAMSAFVANASINDCEDMDVCNSDEADVCQIDIVDPNDIDQIFKRRAPTKSTIPEYISPLNYSNYERYRNVDPLGIMCPYEVNGSCRDIECTYKHYLKNHERL